MNGIILIIGGNLGNREESLRACLNTLQSNQVHIVRSSSVFETASWGNTDNPPFLNQVLEIKTSLLPEELMDYCLDIEQRLGRTRSQKWESRVIDIDILFYHHIIYQSDRLRIPHPHIASRRFVLEPLAEMIPNEIHPVSLLQIKTLLDRCSDELPVQKISSSYE